MDFDALADMAVTVIDGRTKKGKLMKDPSILPAQVLHFRNHVRLLFDDV